MGPLAGLKVVEFAGIGPAPMCAMLLADLGATVIRLDRLAPIDLGTAKPLRYDLLLRSRPAITIDLKKPATVAFVLDLVAGADVLIEGFRPGVMERLGLAPEPCLKRNPRLVYGRMTGWGQSGPMAAKAGHDLNYIALSGVLHAIGRRGHPPTPPLNLVGDYGGGALYLAFGILAAVISARQSGLGQVVDAAMIDGAASLMTAFFGAAAAGTLNPERGSNALDSGAPYYDVYECADGKYLSVAPIEQRFRDQFLARLELAEGTPNGNRREDWPLLRAAIAARLRTRSRDEWVALFSDADDACVAPVLSMRDAPLHPHNVAREVFVDVEGVIQPAAAPRFSQTPADRPTPPRPADTNLEGVLADWGFDAEQVSLLRDSGVLARPKRPHGS